jgi:UDP-N-acetylglucosamine 2-epimerase (non-hydrolysing)
MSVLAVYGTRPEYLKIKPLFRHLKMTKCLARQHTDIINFGCPDISISVDSPCNARLNSIFAEITKKLEPFVAAHDTILVQGDTATTFAVALLAFNLKKRLVHLEAGLRSYNLEHPYPEEGYRQMISRIANINFCPTELSAHRLFREEVRGKIHVVGNTGLDNLISYKTGCTYSNKILVTLHRNENLPLIYQWFAEFESLAIQYPELSFILPLHPNPIIKKAAKNLHKVCGITSLEHKRLIEVLRHSKCVITDSGGIQEEATFFNKKTVVCRRVTERPEGIGTGHLRLCSKPSQLKGLFASIVTDYKINAPCPYGDGHSSEKIAKILKKYE